VNKALRDYMRQMQRLSAKSRWRGLSSAEKRERMAALAKRRWAKRKPAKDKMSHGRAEQSRRLGVRLARYKGVRIFLDELPEDATEKITEDLSCGPQCGDARTSNS